MIYTLTLNPAIDRIYFVPDFKNPSPIRTDQYHAQPGGKGINVTKVLRQLKAEVTTFGFLGGFSGAFIEEKLKSLGTHARFTPIEEETRTTLALQDETGKCLEILETGPTIKPSEINHLRSTLKKHIPKKSILVISGSLPKAIDDTFYAELIAQLKEKAITVILDTSGPALTHALKSQPYLIKPNKSELEALSNLDLNQRLMQLKAIESMLQAGALNVALSLGANGMLFASQKAIYEISVPNIEAINPIGSGDSFIAGFAYGLKHGYNIDRLLKFASALGVSNAKNTEIAKIEVADLKTLESQITVKKL